jgi:hypothetical protein
MEVLKLHPEAMLAVKSLLDSVENVDVDFQEIMNCNAMDRAQLEDAVAAISLQAEGQRLGGSRGPSNTLPLPRNRTLEKGRYSPLESVTLRPDAESPHANLCLTLAQVPCTSALSDLSSFYLLVKLIPTSIAGCSMLPCW